MTHGNLMCAMAGQFESLPPIHKNDIYIGYLPLAHVLELCCENVVLSHGIPVGYSRYDHLLYYRIQDLSIL